MRSGHANLWVVNGEHAISSCLDRGAGGFSHVPVRDCFALRSRSLCFGIADGVARALSDDCSPSAGVAGSKMLFQTSQDRQIDIIYYSESRHPEMRPQKRKEPMADIPVQPAILFGCRLPTLRRVLLNPACKCRK